MSRATDDAAKSPPGDDRHTLARWRLVLGKSAEQHGISVSGDAEAQRIDDLVGFLFEPSGERSGGSGAHTLTVPKWVDEVAQLFPRQAKQVLERELVQRRGLAELLEKPELLERIEPNVELVKTLLTHRDLLSPKTRVLVKKIIQQVVDELRRKLRLSTEQAIVGAIRRDRHSPRHIARNLDLATTVRRNLKHWDEERGRLLVERLYFFAAERRKRPWHVVVAVDQSGSMLDSAIFSAVMASIFAELPSVRTSLVLFDTDVVDLSDRVREPVDVLLSIQLGGGTDITRALLYTEQLVREPGRTILVLISDFYEGRDERDLVNQVKRMSESQIRMIGLGALGYDARPEYNKSVAKKLRKVGMDILVCTPEKLADCMAQIIRG